MNINYKLGLIIIALFYLPNTFSQQNVIMTDVTGVFLYPILSNSQGLPSTLYYL